MSYHPPALALSLRRMLSRIKQNHISKCGMEIVYSVSELPPHHENHHRAARIHRKE